jgi:hypothetical protein
MVRPDRFERPTLWFEASNRRTFIDLALDTVVVQHCLFEVIAVDTWLVNDDRNMSQYPPEEPCLAGTPRGLGWIDELHR